MAAWWKLLFVLPPRSPKLNGHVERAQRTHKDEFYYRLASVTTLAQINKLLRRWEDIHNTYRPHQALGQITPLAFLENARRKEAGVRHHLNEHNASRPPLVGAIMGRSSHVERLPTRDQGT